MQTNEQARIPEGTGKRPNITSSAATADLELSDRERLDRVNHAEEGLPSLLSKLALQMGAQGSFMLP